jgi:glycerol uptake facilitator-like aquaporin
LHDFRQKPSSHVLAHPPYDAIALHDRVAQAGALSVQSATVPGVGAVTVSVGVNVGVGVSVGNGVATTVASSTFEPSLPLTLISRGQFPPVTRLRMLRKKRI